MKTLLISTILFLSLHASSSNAATLFGGAGNVEMYYPVRARLKGGIMINPVPCADNYYYVVPEAHTQYDEYKKIILTALAGGKTVGVYLKDDQCAGLYPEVYSMWING